MVDVAEPLDEEFESPALPMAVPVVDWWRLGPRDKSLVLLDLRWFVNRLVQTYKIESDTIPRLWWRYEGLVVQLLALQQARSTFFMSTNPGVSALDWEDRLAVALPRLKMLVTGYGAANEYRKARIQAWAVDGRQWDTVNSEFEDEIRVFGGWSTSDLEEAVAQARLRNSASEHGGDTNG